MSHCDFQAHHTNGRAKNKQPRDPYYSPARRHTIVVCDTKHISTEMVPHRCHNRCCYTDCCIRCCILPLTHSNNRPNLVPTPGDAYKGKETLKARIIESILAIPGPDLIPGAAQTNALLSSNCSVMEQPSCLPELLLLLVCLLQAHPGRPSPVRCTSCSLPRQTRGHHDCARTVLQVAAASPVSPDAARGVTAAACDISYATTVTAGSKSCCCCCFKP